MEKIIIKYFTNNASPSEIEELEQWIKEEGNQELFEEYVKINFAANHHAVTPNILENKKKILKNIHIKRKASRIKRIVSISKYAAIFIGLLVLALYIGKNNQIQSKGQEYEIESPNLTIAEEQIILKNENGEVQRLNQRTNPLAIHNTQGSQVAQQHGLQIKYDLDSNTEENLVYNEVLVPYGKRFQVTLSDGTLVHLNSGTSLRFPVKFIRGMERRVFLRGEALFNVKKSEGAAFVINSKDIDIKVLGTTFNVSSYNDDEEINTVLVEGSVEIYNPSSKNDNTVVLSPGQMASWNENQKEISVKEVDVDQHTAWVYGRLILRKAPFKLIRKKLERYYNVSIQNENKTLDETRYNVNFDRESIEQVLKTLNENFEIDYQIIDNEIIIN